MATTKKRIDFVTSDEGVWCRQTLEALESDKAYNTEASFTVDIETFPNNQMPFVLTHMTYLAKHAEVNPRHYISNLRLRSRKLM